MDQEINAHGLQVASFTDAWIETSTKTVITPIGRVASFTDAWIETFYLDVKRGWVWRRVLHGRVD